MHPEQPPSIPTHTPPQPAQHLRFAKLAFALCVALLALPSAAHSQTASTTTLTITSGGSPITTIKQGALVTLTATVTAANGSPVSPGQVTFCEVKPAPRKCTDVLLLATEQLLPNGTASYNFHPGAGTHLFQAQFAGTHLAAAAASPVSQLIVTPYIPTTTALTFSVGPNYTLTATVTGTGGVAPPTGTVTFTDQTNQGYQFGTASLAPAPVKSGLSFADIGTAANFFPVTLNAIDLNGDGWPDILWTPACIKEGVATAGGELDSLLGNGDGTFRATAPNVVFGLCGLEIAIADFNGDGIPDLAETSLTDSTHSTYLHIFLGNGDGTFRPGQTFDGNNEAVYTDNSVLSGDFNGDGIPDLVTTTLDGGSIVVFFGNGDGTFNQGPATAITGNPIPILVRDFNGDGIQDLILATGSGTYTLSIALGRGDGTFGTPLPFSSSNSHVAYAADFNDDGILDIAATPGPTYATAIYFGNGDGTFRAPVTVSTLSARDGGDVNNDGCPDLIAPGLVNDSTIYLMLGNCDGTFQPAVAYPNVEGFAGYIAVADFNGDGLADLAVGNSDEFDSSPPFIGAMLSQFNPQIATATLSNVFVLGSFFHTIDAAYPGDAAYQPSSGTALVGANEEPTSLTLTASTTTSAYGQPVQFTATVAPDALQNQVATGTVTFSYANQTIGKATLSNGVATFSATTLPVGNDDVIAIYSGDANFLTSGDDSRQVVSGYASATTLAAAPNPAGLGQSVTLIATVAGAATTLVPTGAVALFDGATQLASVPLDTTGHASYTTSTLSLGTHSLTAVYSSDPVFHASTSAPFIETIIQPSFTLTLASPTISLRTYQHITTTAALASIGAFTDSISLACGNLPKFVTCTFTPNPASLSANSTATVAFYLDTDSILGNGGLARNQPASSSPISLAILLCPVGLFALLAPRRRRPRVTLMLLAILSLPLTLALGACGGNQITPVPSATPGTYSIPITATGTTTNLTRTAQLTLTITP